MTEPARIVFFGGYPMSLAVLRDLVRDNSLKIDLVVTVPTDQGHRTFRNCVIEWLEENGTGIPWVTPAKSSEIAAAIEGAGITTCDLIVSCWYPNRIPRKVLGIATVDTLNVHPSYLPQLRGADPIRWALIRGLTHTGVSIHRMVHDFDAGPVFARTKVEIPADAYFDDLVEILTREAVELTRPTVAAVMGGLTPKAQYDAGISRAPVVKDTDCTVTPATDVTRIAGTIRACYPRRRTSCTIAGVEYSLGPLIAAEPSPEGPAKPGGGDIEWSEDSLVTITNHSGSVTARATPVEAE